MAKVDLYPDFKEFLRSLNSAKVEYLVLGGYAVIYYGYRRVTDDLDVWIAVNSENAERVSEVVRDFFGYSLRSAPPETFLKLGNVFMFGRPPVRIDILTGPSGVDFTECYSRRNTVIWDGIKVSLISLADLKQNKLASGRPKDLADLENLPEARLESSARKTAKRSYRGRK